MLGWNKGTVCVCVAACERVLSVDILSPDGVSDTASTRHVRVRGYNRLPQHPGLRWWRLHRLTARSYRWWSRPPVTWQWLGTVRTGPPGILVRQKHKHKRQECQCGRTGKFNFPKKRVQGKWAFSVALNSVSTLTMFESQEHSTCLTHCARGLWWKRLWKSFKSSKTKVSASEQNDSKKTIQPLWETNWSHVLKMIPVSFSTSSL